MMLKDITHDIGKRLYEGTNTGTKERPVEYQGSNGIDYAITYRHRRSVTVSKLMEKGNRFTVKSVKHRDGSEDLKYIPNYDGPSTTVWDVSGFFQGRFVDILANYFREYIHIVDGHEVIEWPDGLRVDLTHMKTMKNNRQSFTAKQIEEEIVPYCNDETLALERLMVRLKDYLEEADLLPFQSRWYGAGACANTLLQKHHVKEHMHEYMPGPITTARDLNDAQLRAYSAGRFELGKYGFYIGKIWNYDMHSAFPSIMPELPSLTNGMWRHVRGMATSLYSIVHVRWSLYGSVFYPFFYRVENGSIYYPDGTDVEGGCDGWYWKSEVDTALKALSEGKLKGDIAVIESWEFKPYSSTKPFAFVQDIYNKRLQLKESGSPVEKVWKFTINSIYGKLIQSKGWTQNAHGYVKEPSYHNVGYAGYITAGVRAKMFEAIMQAPDQIINIVSDGLYSLVPLDLPIGDNMGQWEVYELDGIILVSPGIYFSLKKLGREPTEQEVQDEFFDNKYLYYNDEWFSVNPHYQGFDRGKVYPELVMKRWKGQSSHNTLWLESTRYVTLASALSGDEYWKYRNTWRKFDRQLSIYPGGKRTGNDLAKDAYPADGLEDTLSSHMRAENLDELGMSNKFERAWEKEDDDEVYIDGVERSIFETEHADSEL